MGHVLHPRFAFQGIRAHGCAALARLVQEACKKSRRDAGVTEVHPRC
jgi:hypothetical protein